MLNYIWAFMIMVGIVYGSLTGSIKELSNAALDSAGEAVVLCITMTGVMALWVGLMEFLETVAGRLLIDAPDVCFELQYELPEQPVYVNADKGRMEQALNNLILNAKRNVQSGGVLKLSLKERGDMLDFSIYNQGQPIPQENLSKIWTKFYRDKNTKYSGSGLGLAIVAQILSMQRIAYGVVNQSGGVVFYFSIPTVK